MSHKFWDRTWNFMCAKKFMCATSHCHYVVIGEDWIVLEINDNRLTPVFQLTHWLQCPQLPVWYRSRNCARLRSAFAQPELTTNVTYHAAFAFRLGTPWQVGTVLEGRAQLRHTDPADGFHGCGCLDTACTGRPSHPSLKFDVIQGRQMFGPTAGKSILQDRQESREAYTSAEFTRRVRFAWFLFVRRDLWLLSRFAFRVFSFPSRKLDAHAKSR